jgi:hypothetical protein
MLKGNKMRDLIEAHQKTIIDAGLEHSKEIASANDKFFKTITESESNLIYQMQIRLDQFHGVEKIIGAKEETLNGIDRDIKALTTENYLIKEEEIQF